MPLGRRAFSSDGIVLTDRARERIQRLRKQHGQADLKIRLLVEGGGCSGFSYKFSIFRGELEEDDTAFGDPPIVIDASSLEFVKGSRIDFTQDLVRSSFEVLDNPQVETSCGCGSSFSLKE